MLRYSQLTLDNTIDTSLKIKIVHLFDINISPGKKFFLRNRSISLQILLKLIYTLRLKKVLSAKLTNRIAVNYVKKFLLGSKQDKFDGLKVNKTSLDSNYVITLGINNLYEDFKFISTVLL